jgi:hypothetical protein
VKREKSVRLTLSKSTASWSGAILLVGCMGYVPGEKAYWDSHIKDLCDKEGHVRIIERVLLSKSELQQMSRSDGKLVLRIRTTKPIDEPVYAQVANASLLNERSPEVRRTELIAVRRSDQKVVARWVEFSRVGGDPPTGLTHESSFHCPDPLQVIAELQPLFLTPE